MPKRLRRWRPSTRSLSTRRAPSRRGSHNSCLLWPTGAFDEATLLRYAASLERASEHPLAQAIVWGAKARGIYPEDASEFRSLTGQGITGKVNGHGIAVGNLRLLASIGIDAGQLGSLPDRLRNEGQTVMFVAVDRQVAGLISVADPIKESTPEAIQLLHGAKVRITMLTGDNRTTAESVARKLGIDEVEAEVLPDQKAETVKRLQAAGRKVAMAGDGCE